MSAAMNNPKPVTIGPAHRRMASDDIVHVRGIGEMHLYCAEELKQTFAIESAKLVLHEFCLWSSQQHLQHVFGYWIGIVKRVVLRILNAEVSWLFDGLWFCRVCCRDPMSEDRDHQQARHP